MLECRSSNFTAFQEYARNLSRNMKPKLQTQGIVVIDESATIDTGRSYIAHASDMMNNKSYVSSVLLRFLGCILSWELSQLIPWLSDLVLLTSMLWRQIVFVPLGVALLSLLGWRN